MTVQTILDELQRRAPFETAEEGDNAGLLVGDANATVTTVVTALDVTDAVIACAIENKAELIVSHHPLCFKPMRTVLADTMVYRLAAAGIALIAAHTNADKAVGGVNDCMCETLGLTDVCIGPDGMSRIGRLPTDMTAEAFAAYVSGVLGTAVRVKTGTDCVRTVALCGGSAADRVIALFSRADAALTGEVKHHEWLEVPAEKTMVDGGHYSTEVVVVPQFTRWLSEAFPVLRVVTCIDTAPYQTIEV